MSFEYKYSLQDLEAMLPYERDIFVAMTAEELERIEKELAKKNGV